MISIQQCFNIEIIVAHVDLTFAIFQGSVGDMEECGIFESFKVKQQVLLSATEAAEMIMRVDDIVKCAPRQRQ